MAKIKISDFAKDLNMSAKEHAFKGNVIISTLPFTGKLPAGCGVLIKDN